MFSFKTHTSLRNTFKLLLFLLFLVYTVWWIYINNFLDRESTSYIFDIFTDSYGTVAALGGICGFLVIKSWGGLKSVMGKSLTFFTVGLFFQYLGQLSYAIYFYVYNIENPYPSFGEVFYFGGIPIYILAVFYLAEAMGWRFSLQKDISNKFVAIFLPIIMVFGSYMLFLKDYEIDPSQPLLLFLDFGYPIGQALFVSLALIALISSSNILGGLLKKNVTFILLALIVQYIADSTFLYETINETWVAGGLSDYLFILSYFLMGISLATFGEVAEKINKGTIK